VIGTALPTDLLVTKALVIPLGIMIGLLWRARPAFRNLRFHLADGAMAAFCLSPLLPMVAGHIGAGAAMVQIGYLAGVWGGSWLIGRTLLKDRAGQADLVRAMAYSGLALIPFALVEGLKGPRLYNLAFGNHPFYGDGVTRYFGARPLGLFEHGNQYGIWIAMAALAANSLALRRETRSRPTIAMALALSACAIASQSIGAIVLAAIGTVWLVMATRVRRATLIAGALLLAVVLATYATGKHGVEYLAYNTAPGQAALKALKASQRGSLSWRVHRDVEALETIRQTPFTGRGQWDWWRALGKHPWGLPLLVAGQYGLLSLAFLAFALLSGAVRALWRGSGDVLPVVVILSAIDAQLNSFIYFNAILAAAAIAAWSLDARGTTAKSPSPRPEPA
jgi:hypothetical protein